MGAMMSGEGKNSKSQIPSSKQIPKSKLQLSRFGLCTERAGISAPLTLKFEPLEFVWNLSFGIWIFVSPPSAATARSRPRTQFTTL
jgi:hypothetical protein